MKLNINTIYSLAAVLLLALNAPAASAQAYVSTPVEISKEKVKIDGKICYSHIVLERQTLYSISKAYGVSVEDIYRFNPSLKEAGLKKNSIIIIPSQDVQQSKAEGKAQQNAKKEGPKKIHVAKWYEDLDVIAEQYGITAEEIMQANNLKGRKLSKRQKLIIPQPGEFAIAPEEDAEAVPADTTLTPADTTTAETVSAEELEQPDSVKTYVGKSKVDMSVILPLTTKEGEPNRNNMDFYSGLLLGVYDMAEEGISCNLNVFDITDTDAVMCSESLKESDVVIGPVSMADLTRLLNASPDIKAVVSPLDPRAERLLNEHNRLIHIPTPHQIQYRDLVSWMEDDYQEGEKILMISEKGARLSGIASSIKEALDSSSLAYNQFSYSILEGRDVTEALTGLMTAEGKNRVVIASESEAFVNDVIRNLNLLIFNNLDIALYAPSKTRGFETIEVENLHNTAMHVSLTYYIDYEATLVKEFLLKYRALFNTEPTQFAFHGYDIARYFIGIVSKYGDDWKEILDDSATDMLQSTFEFNKTLTGSYVNSAVRRIIYDKGYSVARVK